MKEKWFTLSCSALAAAFFLMPEPAAHAHPVNETVNPQLGESDFFTEWFDTTTNDLAFQTFTFTPDSSPNFYSLCREPAAGFPTDPAGGTTVPMNDDMHIGVTLPGTNTVSIYGRRTNVFFIGSNGYLTFDSGDNSFDESFAAHFNRPRVSALFDDLYPTTGQVTWKQMSNRVAVTWLNVTEFGCANTNSFQIELFNDGRIQVTYLRIDALDGLAGLSAGTGLPDGFVESDLTACGTCTLPLYVSVPTDASEGDGVLTGAGQLSLPMTLDTNLSVTLDSSDTSEVTVPHTVMVPAGQTNVTFDLAIVEDAELDGTQLAVITAAAAGCRTTEAEIAVHDNETATLLMSLPSTACEGQGIVTGAVQVVGGLPAADITVALSSSDTTEIQTPATIVIPTGQSSAAFAAAVVDDNQIDGPQPAIITAHVRNWTAGNASITVDDDENTRLTVLLPASAREDSGILTNAGAVSLSGTLSVNLMVTLASDDTTKLIVPSSVTIPAGQMSGFFDLTVIDDPDLDGAQLVQVAAEAAGFTGATQAMTIYDDESPPVPWNPSPAHLATHVIQTTGLSWHAEEAPGEIVTNDVFFGTNPMPGAGDLRGSTTNLSWALPLLAPQTTCYWQIVARGTGTTAGPVWQFTSRGVDYFELSPVPSPRYEQKPFELTVTARDAFEQVVSNFTGPVCLRGSCGSNAAVLFEENFEDGDLSGWEIGPGSYVRTVTDETASGGSHCMSLIGGNTSHGDGISHAFPNLTPARITFHVRAGATNRAGGYFVIGTNITVNHDIIAWFYMAENGTMGIHDDIIGWHGVPYLANQWYKISLLLDWANRRFDYAVNDSLACANIPFRNRDIGSLTMLYLYNFHETQAWWDEILFRDQTLPNPVRTVPTNTCSFTNGKWSGALAVMECATNMILTADDGAGHFGQSTAFDVVMPLTNGPLKVCITPASPTTVGNCIPFGANTGFGFTGFIYRNVPAFSTVPGDKLRFDLGRTNDVDVRRNIYLAPASLNPAAGGDPQNVQALGWTKIVSDSQVPANPRGNNITGDYELAYTIETPFTFAGGGLVIGFGSSPPGNYADGTSDQVLVCTTAGDDRGYFHRRFFFHADQDAGILDDDDSGTSYLGGFIIESALQLPRFAPPQMNGGQVQLRFATVPEQWYWVEYKDALSDSAWLPLQLVSGDGTVRTIIDTNVPGPQRFYRLRSSESDRDRTSPNQRSTR